jgi:UrcA family protein
MHKKYSVGKLICAAAALGIIGGSGVATTPATAQQSDEISIVAPRTGDKERVGIAKGGIPISQVSVTRKILVSGLDLSKPEVVAELTKRINETAKEACDQLNILYPPSIYPTEGPEKNCVEEAAKGGMAQANTLISRAKGG